MLSFNLSFWVLLLANSNNGIGNGDGDGTVTKFNTTGSRNTSTSTIDRILGIAVDVEGNKLGGEL
jgi:hypothetical protein